MVRAAARSVVMWIGSVLGSRAFVFTVRVFIGWFFYNVLLLAA
jgi:hypothetical protein